MPLNFSTAPISPHQSGRRAFDATKAPLKPDEALPNLFPDSGDTLTKPAMDLDTLLASLRKQVDNPQADHSSEPFQLPRLLDKVERDPSQPIDKQLGGLTKNILGAPEDIISGLLTLPINLLKDPNGTMGAMAMYPQKVIENLINADFFDLGFDNSGLGPDEFEARKQAARDELFLDPLGPANVAAMFAGVVKGGGPSMFKRAGNAAKEINVIKTAQTLLGEESAGEWAAFARENKPGARSRVVKKAGQPEIPESPTVGATATPEGVVTMDAPLPVEPRSTGVPPTNNFQQFLQQLRGEGGVSVGPSEIGSPAKTKAPKLGSGAAEVKSLIQQLDEIEGQARKRIEDRLKSGTFTSGGLIDIADYAVIGSAKIAKGVINFGAWSKEMVTEFGDEIKPRLREIWDEANARLDRMGIKRPEKSADDLVGMDDPMPSPVRRMSEVEADLTSKNAKNIMKNTDDKPSGGFELPETPWYRRMVADWPVNVADKNARNWIVERVGDIELRDHRLGKWLKTVRTSFPEAERAEMVYHLQKTKNPFTGKAPALSDAAKKFVDETLKPRNENLFQELVDNGLLDDAQHVENFITQIWDFGGDKAKISRMAMKIRQGRKIPSVHDGVVEFGLKPMFKDVIDIQRFYEKMHTRVVFNQDLVNKLWNTADIEGRRGLQPLTKSNRHLLDEGWTINKSQALGKALYVTRKGKGGKPVTLLRYPETLVSPAYSRPVANVFNEMWNPKWFNAVRNINTTAKVVQLFFSLFHPFTLAESGLGLGIKGPFKHKFGLSLMDDPAFLDEMVKKGEVMLGTPSEVGKALVDNLLLKLESKTEGIPLVNQASHALRRYKEIFDEQLWEKYQTGLKAYSYYKQKEFLLEKFPDMHPDLISKAAGDFTNKAFGGLNWTRMMINPHVQDVAHASLLAPDWTFANAQQGLGLFKSSRIGAMRAKFAGLPDDVIKQVAASDMMEGAMARRYWARTGLYTFLGIQMLNLAFTAADEDGEPRFTWENPGDHTLDFFVGRDEKGNGRYASPQKQAKEVLRWVTDLPGNLGSKASPVVRLLGEQLTSHDVGSGFPAPWAREDEFGIKPTFLESIPQRLLGASETYIPFSFSGDNFAFTLPVSKGMTSYRFIQEYRRAYLDGNKGQMQRIELSGRFNNLDVKKLKSQAKSKVNSGKRQADEE